MKKLKSNHLLEIGQRLSLVRNEAGLTRGMMALKLGIPQKSYYKHESGIRFPCFETLRRLQTEFDLALDWLLFKKGPMYTKDKQVIVVEEKKITDLEKKFPDTGELLAAMEQDHILLHEVMLFFYKYRQDRQPIDKNGNC